MRVSAAALRKGLNPVAFCHTNCDDPTQLRQKTEADPARPTKGPPYLIGIEAGMATHYNAAVDHKNQSANLLIKSIA